MRANKRKYKFNKLVDIFLPKGNDVTSALKSHFKGLEAPVADIIFKNRIVGLNDSDVGGKIEASVKAPLKHVSKKEIESHAEEINKLYTKFFKPKELPKFDFDRFD